MGFVEVPVEPLRALRSPELVQSNGNAISADGSGKSTIPSASNRRRANLFLPLGKSASALSENGIHIVVGYNGSVD